MRYGIVVVPFGSYADPKNVVQFGREADSAGWEALFVWDHLAYTWGVPSGDPWVTLTTVAQATENLGIGTGVTPLSRHHSHVLANMLTTLDLLSDDRFIFDAELGAIPQEFSAHGKVGEVKPRTEMLDEGLEIIDHLMSWESVTNQGFHYSVENITLTPVNVQRPQIPIWIGGDSPPALQQAAQWDGWVLGVDDEYGQKTKTPDENASQVTTMMECRPNSDRLYYIAIMGQAYSKMGL